MLKDIFDILQHEDVQKQWKEIYTLHRETKKYLLIAEETSEDGVALIQPLKEHRDAYDHIIRTFASTAKTIPDNVDYLKYVKDNLSKAYGHEYRAFFDTADWLAYNLRKDIRIRIENIPRENRRYLVPDYERTIVQLNEYPFEVADVRNDKDVTNGHINDNACKRYMQLLDWLIDLYKKIV